MAALTLIKNAKLVPAPDNAATISDILILGSTIAEIGKLPRGSADVIIDAKGGEVLPGLIDCCSDADMSLSIFLPTQWHTLCSHGVTTILGGAAGSSLAPTPSDLPEIFMSYSAGDAVNRNWRTLTELTQAIEALRPPFRFATVAGYHSTIAALPQSAKKHARKNAAAALLGEMLQQGARGVSLLVTRDMRRWKEPLPSLLPLLANRDLPLIVAAAELLTEKEAHAIVRKISEEKQLAGRPILFTRIPPYPAVLAYLARIFEHSPRYFAVAPSGGILLPLAALAPLMARRERKRAIDLLPPPSHIFIARAPTNSAIAGQHLWHLTRMHRLADTLHALQKTAELTRGHAAVLLRYPRFAPAATIRELPFLIPAAGTFAPLAVPATLPELLAAGPQRSLDADLVTRATLLPARLFHFPKRGAIARGYAADLVCITNGEVQWVVREGEKVYDQQEQHSRSPSPLHP
ncbi:hypothetical protein D6833_10050 [Candidatus Parcubacteria bacterium]|nr:MAG: hypothetical protein D6833_10050 [Candidatus Parcubacteria bacterium]